MLIILFICISTLVSARPTRQDNLSTPSSSPTQSNVPVASDPFLRRLLAPAPRSDISNDEPKLQGISTDSADDISDHPSQNSTYTDIPIFNPLYPQREIREVAAKYIHAKKYLRGQDLSPLPNFTYLASLLGDNDPTAQVAGSTFVLSLQTYDADVAYYGQVSLGSPAQSFLFDVDTGSADLWVPSNCPDCNIGKPQFDPMASSTYFDTGQPFSLAYGTGQVEGSLARETVTMGQMSIDGQYFGAVSTESNDFSDVPFDGIIGMAFSSISTSRQPTFMERLIQARKVNVAAFGVHLTRHQPRQSEVCIGCYDPSKYNGAITWNPVTSRSYWSIALDNIKVNGVNGSPRTVSAAIDTGTSLIYLPQDLADSVYRQIRGARRAPQLGGGFYTYPCSSRPTVSLVFGLQSYAIDLQDFNLGRANTSGRDCVGGIIAMGNDFPPNLAIIGDEFLKSWYSIYDYDHGARVGFATSINNHYQ